MKTQYDVQHVPAPAGAYSQVLKVGEFIFTAGFGPQDPATGQVPDGIKAQTAQAIENVERALQAAGGSLDGVVKMMVHLSDIDGDFAEYDEAYRACVPEPYPVRTTVGAMMTGIKVEIDAIAVVKES